MTELTRFFEDIWKESCSRPGSLLEDKGWKEPRIYTGTNAWLIKNREESQASASKEKNSKT